MAEMFGIRKRGLRFGLAFLQALVCIAFMAKNACENSRLRQAGWDPGMIYRVPDVSTRVFGVMNLPAILIASLPEI
jgi:hypothetical protein